MKSTCLLLCSLLSTQICYGYWQIPGVGASGQGADVVATNLDSNPDPELILMAYDDAVGQNTFRYRVAHNLRSDGYPTNYTNTITVNGVGWEAQGAGAAITQLDTAPRPELILMAYDSPAGANTFRYRVGYNLDEAGIAQRWSNVITVPGVGWEAQGADILTTNLDDNFRPEIILLALDSPTDRVGGKSLRYKIGWNVDPSGVAASWSQDFIVPVAQTLAQQGLGAAIVNIGDDPRPSLLVATYQDDYGTNSFQYQLGLNLNSNGTASSWHELGGQPGVGGQGQGIGIAVINLNDNSHGSSADQAYAEIIQMAYDNPNGQNSFRYEALTTPFLNANVFVELDKVSNVSWPSGSAFHRGRNHSLQSIYGQVGVSIVAWWDEENLPPPSDGSFDNPELDAFMARNRNLPINGPQHMYLAILNRHEKAGTTGIMFDHEERRGAAIFMDALAQRYGADADKLALRTMAHELGHAFCLRHADADGGSEALGRSIMETDVFLAEDWDFTWSATEFEHFYNHSRQIWLPGSGFQFLGAGPQNFEPPGCH